jgi:peptidase A4-like protein
MRPLRSLSRSCVAAGTLSAVAFATGLVFIFQPADAADVLVLTGSCPAHSQAQTPAARTRLPDGGVAYDYFVDGIKQTQYVPPAGFAPLKASQSDLERYSFPPRPSNPAQYATWAAKARSYKGARAAVMCLADHQISGPIKGSSGSLESPTGDHEASTNWSGYVGQSSAPAEANHPFAFVEGQWVQTGWGSCGCTEPTDESTWAGIGGRKSASLIQAGTDMYSSDVPNAWYEYLHPCPTDPSKACGPSEIASGTVTPSSTVITTTYHIGNVAHFFLEANGIVVLSTTATLDSSYFDGTDAEWINERPTYSFGYLPLTSYGVQNWSTGNCAAASSAVGTSCYDPSQLTPIGVEMLRQGGFVTPACSSPTLLAYPAGLSGANFQSHWCRAT